jgi:hypothetical protein
MMAEPPLRSEELVASEELVGHARVDIDQRLSDADDVGLRLGRIDTRVVEERMTLMDREVDHSLDENIH